jgi:pyruvate formate lyase activating enzyme
VRLSTCDWPGQLCATIFCQGCGWNCPYCHNQALRAAHGAEAIAWSRIESFLKQRQGLLDALVFSGGEPTLQAALLPALEQVKRIGFRIGLHTTGPAPSKLAPLLPLLDWVGFDVKAPFDDYARITGVEGSGTEAKTSLQLLLAAGVTVEARTTAHAALLSSNDLLQIEQDLLAMGVSNYVVQQARRSANSAQNRGHSPLLPLPALGADFGSRFARFSLR